MFNKNLKFYRLRKGMTKVELANKVGVTPTAITHYENGDKKPNMVILKALAAALEVRVSDFLIMRNEQLTFIHGDFRKNTSLSEKQQDYIRESVEEYFNRFMTIVEILGGNILPDAPDCHILELSDNIEENAINLRKHLGFASDGSIEELIGKLEDKGILVFECNIDNNNFSGMNGFVNNRPYIVIKSKMIPERKRSTIVHELAHLMFIWPNNIPKKSIEQTANAISGAFLLPEKDAIRELGISRSKITKDMLLVATEYGISMWLLVRRAAICNIISETTENTFYIQASQIGWKTAEPSRINEESPMLFRQLVYRAVNENEISIQRGAELLKVPYKDILSMSSFNEE